MIRTCSDSSGPTLISIGQRHQVPPGHQTVAVALAQWLEAGFEATDATGAARTKMAGTVQPTYLPTPSYRHKVIKQERRPSYVRQFLLQPRGVFVPSEFIFLFFCSRLVSSRLFLSFFPVATKPKHYCTLTGPPIDSRKKCPRWVSPSAGREGEVSNPPHSINSQLLST